MRNGYSAVILAGLLLVWFSACNGKPARQDRTENKLSGSSRTASTQNWKTVTAPSGLKLRTAPHTRATVLNLIPPQTRVRVIDAAPSNVTIGGRTGRWHRVSWTPPAGGKAHRGWVFGGWLR